MKVCPVVKSDFSGAYDWLTHKRIADKHKRMKKSEDDDFETIYKRLSNKGKSKQ